MGTAVGYLDLDTSKFQKGFKDAELVITDSFHACVFSIIFNKPFIVIDNLDRGTSRIDNLLNKFCSDNSTRQNEIIEGVSISYVKIAVSDANDI